MPAVVENLVKQVFSVGLEQVILLGLPLRGAPAGLPAVFNDRGDIRAVVSQRNADVFRFLSPVAPLQPDDPLQNNGVPFRQRHPAHPVQLQPVETFAGLCAHFQTADGNIQFRLAVPVQQALCPRPQVLLCCLVLVGFHPVNPAIKILVFAKIVSVDMQVVFPDGVDPGEHTRPADALPERAQVPATPHLACRVGAAPPDV